MGDRVIIAGGGPVGLFTAINFCHHGIPVTLIEEEGQVCQHVRAGGFHPPSVDMMEDCGLAARMKEVGYKFSRFHFMDRMTGQDVYLDMDCLKNDTRNPWDLLALQPVLTNCAYDMLVEGDYDIEFRFNTRVERMEQDGDRVTVHVIGPNGPEVLTAPWLMGCDGSSSAVRKSLKGVEFEGFTWPQRFLMAHTKYDFEPEYGLVTFISDAEKWQMIMKLPYGPGPDDFVWRMVCQAPDDMSDEEAMTPEYTQMRMQDLNPNPEPYEIFGPRVYRVHQRVASEFRQGRVVLVGDAAHINNPIGGQGLNCGIHDVANLTEKFVPVWRGEADERLLDLYVRQRRLTNIEFIQKVSIENKERMDNRDYDTRMANRRYMESLEHDDEARRQFFLRFAMFDSLKYAASIQ